MKSGNVQEEFAPYASLRGASQSTGVVATEGSVESLRERMSEAERHPVKERRTLSGTGGGCRGVVPRRGCCAI